MKCKIIFLILLFSIAIKAQTFEGTIIDSLREPVPYIPLALLNARDSSIVKGTNTNENGYFSFENIKPGKYLVKIDVLGFKAKFSSVYIVDTLLKIDAGVLVINSSAVNLNEVSVTTIKKLVEYKNGNITVNIENSPLAVGNSLYDLLSRLPSVTIIDDIISIQGKGGARILIDERLQQMSGQQLITLLKSIQASTIEKIEILKNPPVKYDAAGVGFISVKTKKLRITGFSGSTNMAYSQGFYANKDVGLSLNYKGKSFAVFSSINGGNNEYLYTSHFNKSITYDGVTTIFDQLTAEKNCNLYTNYTFGADWYINKQNTVGFRIEGSNGNASHDRKGVNNLSDSSLGYNQLLFLSKRPNAWNYINYNLNAEHLFDTLGTILRFSFDYSPNQDLNSGDFENYFRDLAGNTKLPPELFKSDNNLQFNIYSSKLDFENQLSKTLKLEAGLKANNQSMTTNFNFNQVDPYTGEYSVDTTLTNGFRYNEQISAAYLNFLKDYKKFNFQLGLRGENTSIQAENLNNEISYTRNYFNLFPTASINYNRSEKHIYQLSYNRRINRPGYAMFNPYKYFVNLFVSFRGNPYLRPEYYHNIEFSHGYKSTFYNTLAFSVINNFFYGYPVQNDSTKETLQQTSNLDQCYNFSYSTFIQKELTRWWMLTFNGVASYLTFSGKIDGNDYTGTSLQANGFLNNQFTLSKSVKIELAASYLAPTKVVINNQKSLWAVDIGIRKNFLKDKLNVAIGMNDIFYSWVTGNTVRYLNINSTLKTTNDTQRFKASLTYNFGKVKVRQRQTKSNQEEKDRLAH
jgi:hypothetical protein